MTRLQSGKPCILGLILLLFAAASAGADVTLPSLVGDNMVLQQGESAGIWGRAEPSEKVSVQGSWQTEAVTATADRDGRWRLALPLPAAGGPYSIRIVGRNELELNNVMVGEVWVCSGQSNMEMGVSLCSNADEEIAAADFPDIRLFMVPRTIAARPGDRLGPDLRWKVCTPETVVQGGWGGFSAAAYYFGRRLHKELQTPIGLIQAAWGGTPAESWTALPMLGRIGGYEREIEESNLLADHPDKVEAMNRRRTNEWESELARVDAGMGKEKWYAPDFDDSAWETMVQPVNWNENDLRNFDGVVWFRKRLDLPPEWNGRELVLELGPIDDADRTWVNGTLVGETGNWTAERKYTVPAAATGTGRVCITVRVLDTGGAGGIYGAGEKLKIHPADSPGDCLPLAGPWRFMKSAGTGKIPSRPPLLELSAYATASSLFNGMISPILPFTIKGAIWYQGESNSPRSRRYEELLKAMIDCWRERWRQGDFPFYYVQIAPFLYWSGADGVGIREAQRRVLSHPGTGMVVTSDIGNIHDIHPRNKQDVGGRLALLALAKTYGRAVDACSGPLLRSMTVEGSRVRLRFDYCGSGLAVRKGHGLSSFRLAGSDGIFLPARAVLDGNSVVLSSPLIKSPVSADYAWSDTAEGHLINREGLPASCFSTAWNRAPENRNTALAPVPKAGWWWQRHEAKLERIRRGGVDLLFIGDSITHNWENEPYREVWDRYYAHRKAVNLGFSGDRTENVLWRLQSGEIDGISPRVAVVMIGTNNTDGIHFPTAHTAAELAEGIIAVCKTLRSKLPDTKIIMLCPFPCGEKPNARRSANLAAGALASRMVDRSTVCYLDIGEQFLNPDGTIGAAVMPDFLHPSREGHLIWARAMEPLLSRLLGDEMVK